MWQWGIHSSEKSMKSQCPEWVSQSWLLDSQREWTRQWESGPSKKSCQCDFFFFFFFSFICLFFPPLIFRIYHGRLVAIPGTQTAATPTTASQTPQTSPALWWSSGSKLGIRVSLDHKDTALLWTDFRYTEMSSTLLGIMKGQIRGQSDMAICITHFDLPLISIYPMIPLAQKKLCTYNKWPQKSPRKK